MWRKCLDYSTKLKERERWERGGLSQWNRPTHTHPDTGSRERNQGRGTIWRDSGYELPQSWRQSLCQDSGKFNKSTLDRPLSAQYPESNKVHFKELKKDKTLLSKKRMMIADVSSATTELEDNEKHLSQAEGHCPPQIYNENTWRERMRRPRLWEPWTKKAWSTCPLQNK